MKLSTGTAGAVSELIAPAAPPDSVTLTREELEQVRGVARRAPHTATCRFDRLLTDYSKGRGSYPSEDGSDCDCGIYAALALLDSEKART